MIIEKQAGKRLYITGIPTSGKSFLAKKLAGIVGGVAVLMDDVREDMKNDERYKKFVNFYWDKDEEKYYTTTSPNDQWNNLVMQSEGMWPAFIEKIEKYKDETRPVIFECVNILPHLAKRSLYFDGLVIIGHSYEETLERIKQSPRWGSTEHLKKLEAESFFYVERPKYKTEAKKYKYSVFESADEALESGLKLLQ